MLDHPFSDCRQNKGENDKAPEKVDTLLPAARFATMEYSQTVMYR